MKKGASHVDWVISIGIFIMYILILLVWIKPGYKPAFEQDTLVNLVKNNIEDDFSVEVHRSLLKIDNCAPADGYISINLDSVVSDVGSDFKVVDLDGEDVNFDNRLRLKTSVSNELWVVSSDFFSSYSENPADWEALGEAVCSAPIGGETLIRKGLSANLLAGLSEAKVNGWGFPSSREFKIFVDIDVDESIDQCYGRIGNVNCDTFQPDSNAAVYATEWRYNIVENEDGDLKPVLLTILIW